MKRSRRIDWPACAASLAAAIPREKLHREVLGWAATPSARRQTWGVAVSGGSDSVALLLLLWAHWPERRHRLRLLHFDHALRGRESTGDAEFCRRVAAALGVEFVMARWRRPRRADLPSEAAARTARLSFLHANARVIWLAHHQDDVPETMLMRLARGSGAAGMAAPRPVQPYGERWVHLRPLLTLRKDDLIAALRRAEASWRDDRTNGREDYFRNRIRRLVVPAWVAAAQRDAVAGAARTRELLAEDDSALESWVDQTGALSARNELFLARLRGKPRAVWRRALHRWLQVAPVPVDVSRQAFEGLLHAAEAGNPTRHSLGAQLFAVLWRDRLTFQVGKVGRKIQRRVN